MAGKGKFPKMLGMPARVTAKMPARSSAPVTGGSVTYAAGPGPVRRLPSGKRAHGPKGMP